MLGAAEEHELPAVVALANSAYRDAGAQGWTTEADYIAGQRLDLVSLKRDLEAQPEARLLLWREDGQVLGSVWLEPAGGRDWRLGLLIIRPDLQGQGGGRRLLQAAEDAVRDLGGDRVEMSVVNLRASLIAWYQRRGYRLTGERRPFPYGDERFGRPLRDDLEFVVMDKFL